MSKKVQQSLAEYRTLKCVPSVGYERVKTLGGRLEGPSCCQQFLYCKCPPWPWITQSKFHIKSNRLHTGAELTGLSRSWGRMWETFFKRGLSYMHLLSGSKNVLQKSYSLTKKAQFSSCPSNSVECKKKKMGQDRYPQLRFTYSHQGCVLAGSVTTNSFSLQHVWLQLTVVNSLSH